MKIIFLFTCIVAMICSCNKVTDTSAPLAQYSLGNGDSCTGATLSGQFAVDTPLTTLNTVAITVKVDSVGPFWIVTNTKNGISFSQIGTFTTTGIQTVVLTGTGTPIATDTTTFTITPKSGLGNSCTFSVPVISYGPPRYYLNGYFNDNYENFGDSAGATNGALAGPSGFPGLEITGTDTVVNSTGHIDFGISYSGPVSPGNYSDTSSLPAYFTFTDTLGNAWKPDTSFRPAFTISLVNVFKGSVQGTFSGRLRIENGTDSISVTNGAFLVPLR
ncbi:MAG: hypothetical protein Q8891_13470 [Bacteroidota bacterium]|nr:hypothetical protein [Bacteroidota bacterium]